MAVTASAILYPSGEIRPEWFAEEDPEASLSVWIAEGEAKVPAGAPGAQADAVVVAWAHHRAFNAKAAMMAADPDSVTLPALATTVSVGRVKFFSGKAAEWLEVFEVAIGAATPAAPSTAPARGYSRSIAMRTNW